MNRKPQQGFYTFTNPHRITNAMNASYGQDLHAWAMTNATLLRQGRSNEADLENIAEELEAMGRSERRQLERAVDRAPHFGQTPRRQRIADLPCLLRDSAAGNRSPAKFEALRARAA